MTRALSARRGCIIAVFPIKNMRFNSISNIFLMDDDWGCSSSAKEADDCKYVVWGEADDDNVPEPVAASAPRNTTKKRGLKPFNRYKSATATASAPSVALTKEQQRQQQVQSDMDAAMDTFF